MAGAIGWPLIWSGAFAIVAPSLTYFFQVGWKNPSRPTPPRSKVRLLGLVLCIAGVAVVALG